MSEVAVVRLCRCRELGIGDTFQNLCSLTSDSVPLTFTSDRRLYYLYKLIIMNTTGGKATVRGAVQMRGVAQMRGAAQKR